MKKMTFSVNTEIEVTVDETKFTDEFLEEFNTTMFQCDEVEDHMRHIAELAGTGQIGIFDDFLEGYGPLEDFGIKFTVKDSEVCEMR